MARPPTMPSVQRSPFRTDHYASLSRRPRKSFVRRAAVMQVVPVSARVRKHSSSSESDGADSDGAGEDRDREVGGPATGDARGRSHTGDATAVPESVERAGSVQVPPSASVPQRSRKRSAPGADAGGRASPDAPPPVRTPRESDSLAERLAARSRNPRIFPVTCWTPAAASASASRPPQVSGALPPTAPPTPRRVASLGVDAGLLWQHIGVLPAAAATAPPPPPPSASVPLSPLASVPLSPLASAAPPRRSSAGRSLPPPSPTPSLDDDSSSDMHDDDLVAAYITPPASPTASALQSPRFARPSSGKRRRSSGRRAAQASRAAIATVLAPAAPVVDGRDQSLSLDDLHDTIRSGFASVRRELTRFRGELVVVKSQAASSLRRMDVLAASADGSQAGNGVMVERLMQVEKALKDVGNRILTKAGEGDAPGVGAQADSVPVINEIKVCQGVALLGTQFSGCGGGGASELGARWCEWVDAH